MDSGMFYLVMIFGGILLLAAAVLKFWYLFLLGIIVVVIIVALSNFKEKEKRITALQYNLDDMSGIEFEVCVAELLKKIGYRDVTTTKATGDYGVDIIAHKDGHKYVIQCKRYSISLGVKPVQEVYSGQQYYKADRAVVVTNAHFTQNAKELAQRTGVELWDREKLISMLRD